MPDRLATCGPTARRQGAPFDAMMIMAKIDHARIEAAMEGEPAYA